ncbi:hypothetical protein SOVF_179180 [Spinacia oleracea]|uniref:DUF538 domain-containing protein n=1 Tax=Spinacia oleracea TaxID=3562 RepID=A0ABM3RBN6_SPIOL|nr:uncharacterized protein LOC110780696 [Spinacia oleracea]KNA06630.1 hypothetical protein SOVF_179180 [Spinacia oleracea]
MAKLLSLLPFSILLLFSLCSAKPNPNSLKAAHTELTAFGFPVGLLPSNVADYSINHTSGDFSIKLSDQCMLTLPPDNYLATYSKIVRGKIVKNKIAQLDGIRVRALFQWWSITGIRSSGDDLVFEVGMLSAKYPAKNFKESPPCEGLKADS